MEPPIDIVDRHRKPTPTRVVQVETDWCDSCLGSGAHVHSFVFAELPSGRSLSWCGHHGTLVIDALEAIGATVIDMRHTIAVTTEEPDDA